MNKIEEEQSHIDFHVFGKLTSILGYTIRIKSSTRSTGIMFHVNATQTEKYRMKTLINTESKE